MKFTPLAAIALTLVLVGAGCTQATTEVIDSSEIVELTESTEETNQVAEETAETTEPNETIDPAELMKTYVTISTEQGDIVIELYNDMPITAGNFSKLAEEGFYDGVIFHRVMDGFMIQGGDPTGTGSGSDAENIEDEFVAGHSNVRGTISMANTGRPNSGSSQFFINLVDNTSLDFDKPPSSSKHPVFGEVVEGMDVVDAIAKVEVGSGSRPLEDVVMIKVTIEQK